MLSHNCCQPNLSNPMNILAFAIVCLNLKVNDNIVSNYVNFKYLF